MKNQLPNGVTWSDGEVLATLDADLQTKAVRITHSDAGEEWVLSY